jgi:hypothetical protein
MFNPVDDTSLVLESFHNQILRWYWDCGTHSSSLSLRMDDINCTHPIDARIHHAKDYSEKEAESEMMASCIKLRYSWELSTPIYVFTSGCIYVFGSIASTSLVVAFVTSIYGTHKSQYHLRLYIHRIYVFTAGAIDVDAPSTNYVFASGSFLHCSP